MPTFVLKEITAVHSPARSRTARIPNADRKLPPLTREHVARCRKLRNDGLPLNEIARKLGTNIGRVSEAINGKRKGI